VADSPLIDVAELRDRLDDPRVRIADVRWRLGKPGQGRADYDAGHLPGAIYVDLDRDLAAAGPGPHPQGGRHPLPPPADFARRMAALGFRDTDTIVAYDDTGGTVAARLWWMLDDLGFAGARLLDGGLAAWTAAGLPLSTDARDLAPSPSPLTLHDRWSRAIDRESLIAGLGTLTLLDVRAPERYRGDVEPVDRVPGHIPTARNLPTTGNVGPDARFLEPDALHDHLVGAGAAGADTVVSCGSGVNAAHTALAMRLAGLPAPLLYAGSYSDWSAANLPVADGDQPGELLERPSTGTSPNG
jgi:thiosulfate/3-mercaptopyruvate sulfurtransferase